MERPIFKPVGTPVEQLDTPALVVDLEVLERNIGAMHSFFRERDAKLRPSIQSHMCPPIAHKQLAAGGTVGGISVTTVGQAEVFCASGFTDIFVANVIVTPPKISRLCALARHAAMTVAVDNAGTVSDLSETASASGVGLNVVVGIDTGDGLLGVEPGGPAVDLAGAIRDAAGLKFAGLMGFQRSAFTNGAGEIAAESRKRIQRVLDARQAVEKAGMDVRVVSVGGTDDYEIAGTMDGVTEVPAGSYALMDQELRQRRPQFQPAARVMATVASVPGPGVAVTDGGQKAIGSDTGLPALEGLPGVQVKSLSAEHGNLTLDTSVAGPLGLGDKVWLTPWDTGSCVDLHDYVHGVRDGLLEVVWKVAARGRFR